MRYIALLAILAACGDDHAAPDAPRSIDSPGAVDGSPDGNPLEPDTLFGTGLCVDKACTTISSDAQPYTPQFVLWADTASKRRWIYLPPGAKIDTTDMDHWVFPMGTKIWKEFTRDGVRVETRYIAKVGPGNAVTDWYYMAYQWNTTNDDTMAVPSGVVNANGTQHDIPAVYQCKGCHENLKPTRILGFGAIQLDYANPTAGELDLDRVIAAGVLTADPGGSSPHYPLPSDSNNASATAALGYVHANCGHCHNPTSSVFTDIGVSMVLRMDIAHLATVGATPAYTTAVGAHISASPAPNGDTTIVVAGDPAHSVMIDRFESTDVSFHMPQLGSKMMDPDGDTLLRAWITNLQ